MSTPTENPEKMASVATIAAQALADSLRSSGIKFVAVGHAEDGNGAPFLIVYVKPRGEWRSIPAPFDGLRVTVENMKGKIVPAGGAQ
jgi:hypothetical protein